MSGEARWLGVQIQGQAEQPRVLLVAVPYALKSRDAETLGGLPASAFLLAAPSSGAASATAANDSAPTPPPPGTITGTGTAGFLPDFTGATTIGNSAVFQTGASPTAKIGINTSTPAGALDVTGNAVMHGPLVAPATGVATATTGKNSQPHNFVASAFNSGTSTAVSQTFQLKAEPAGNNTATASGTLNLLFGQGTSAPAETGLKISSKGLFTFAAGQTFPGTGSGTVTSVGSGAGLTGGPITTSGTLKIATAGVTNAMLQNPSLTVTAGTDLTGGGSVALGSSVALNLDTTKVPLLAASNTFTATQAFTGNPGIRVTNSSADGIDISAGSGIAVYGVSASSTGVDGYSNGFDGGVFEAGSTGAYGSRSDSFVDTAFNTGAAGWEYGSTQKTIGVWGYAASGIGIASYGEAYSASAQGSVCCAGFYPIGVWADTSGNTSTSNPGIGALTTVDNGWSIVAYNNSAFSTVFLENEESSSNNSLVMETVGGNFGGVCTIDVSGNLFCSGSKSAVVPVDGGAKKVALYAVEAPENWFEDAGSAQLSNGSAVIQLENMFGQAVNTGIDYHVFLTPNGDCKGLYVSQKSATSFEVHELGGGTSSIAFDYRIMAKRKGYENIRMADKTEQFTAHRPTRRPAGQRVPSPDEYRKAHLQKAQELSKKKVVTTAVVRK